MTCEGFSPAHLIWIAPLTVFTFTFAAVAAFKILDGWCP